MSDWRSSFRSPGSDAWLHPDAPSSGSGPGHFHQIRSTWDYTQVPHPQSPAGRVFGWFDLPHIDVDDRLKALLEALSIAEAQAPRAVLEATGEELSEILHGLIPGLLLCLCVVTATTAVGAAGGAAIGALAGGIGAIPGAVLGAGLGLEAGMALLEFLGIAFLAVLIGKSLAQATGMAASAVNEAWHAIDDAPARWFHVQHAGETLAASLAVLMRGILQGLVAFLLARGASAAASRVPELVARLRASRLGKNFAAWVEAHWASLLRNERLQSPRQGPRGDSGASTGSASSSARPSQESGVPTPRPGEAQSAPAEPPAAEPSPPPRAAPKAEPLPKGAPDPNARARGVPEQDPRAPRAKQENLARQNDSADRLAREGYDIEHNSEARPNGKVPDYKISGEYVDHVNVRSNNVDQARRALSSKVKEEQADRIVARLDDTNLSIEDVQAVLGRKPIATLKEVIFIKGDVITSYVP